MYEEALLRGARPKNLLDRKYCEFKIRMEHRDAEEISEETKHNQSSSRALQDPAHDSLRTAAPARPISKAAAQTSTKNQIGKLKVYLDTNEDGAVDSSHLLPEVEKLSLFDVTADQRKENKMEATKWVNQKINQAKIFGRDKPAPKIEVFKDDDNDELGDPNGKPHQNILQPVPTCDQNKRDFLRIKESLLPTGASKSNIKSNGNTERDQIITFETVYDNNGNQLSMEEIKSNLCRYKTEIPPLLKNSTVILTF